MKKPIFFAFLFLVPFLSMAQQISYDNDSLAAHPKASSVSLFPQSSIFNRDTTLHQPSYYIQKCSAAQTREVLFFCGAATFVGLSYLRANDSGKPETGFLVVGVACGIAGLVNHFMSIVNLREAGRAFERVQLTTNGVSISL